MSFRYSQHSLTQRETLHGDLQLILDEVLKIHDLRIVEGFRPEEKQNEMYRKGLSKLPWPRGRHNQQPSEAADLLPFVNGKPIGWEATRQWDYFGGLVIGVAAQLRARESVTHRIRWGGDWSRDHDLRDQSFNDLMHFELIAT
jgi:peptidoglycan L-alanyl-D-glutamate endopeptidase CwlK